MKWSNGGRFRLLLLSALLFAGSLSWCQPASAQTPPLPQPTPSISQLKDNLTQALALCTTLKANLDLRIASFQTLQDSYQKLVQAQEQLQKQLADLQQSLSDSERQSRQAQADLQAMRDLSAKLQTSLAEASKSLAAYKSETDKAVIAMALQRDGWKYAAVILGTVAIVEGGYIGGHALGLWR